MPSCKQPDILATNICTVGVHLAIDWKWLQHCRDLILISGVVLLPLRRPSLRI